MNLTDCHSSDATNRFDVFLDKDYSAHSLILEICKRNFPSDLPEWATGDRVEVARGVGQDWYALPLPMPSGEQRVKPLVDKTVMELATSSIGLKGIFRLKILSHHREPLDWDPVMTDTGVRPDDQDRGKKRKTAQGTNINPSAKRPAAGSSSVVLPGGHLVVV
ncbi:uncharacterized protein HMPREF1541_01210 [Cyphellophora europaea CBS 101466]|uniref:Uncharacterized protein n=1 Tax=Cyphellophora europaea (strain CBS 101466) TaxID=1220924 RepID=W2SEH1_CYPE1|nr:uncharacterized protein HMPREF1541_01210 [Cyphellophora europaea CBS 101466]ETN47020.1 hypothetical protein HMPREF1541_01210 [Cyphellophora europaea CBS 101466]